MDAEQNKDMTTQKNICQEMTDLYYAMDSMNRGGTARDIEIITRKGSTSGSIFGAQRFKRFNFFSPGRKGITFRRKKWGLWAEEKNIACPSVDRENCKGVSKHS
jgi:hypothetical protein